jgi:hypothetical protein
MLSMAHVVCRRQESRCSCLRRGDTRVISQAHTSPGHMRVRPRPRVHSNTHQPHLLLMVTKPLLRRVPTDGELGMPTAAPGGSTATPAVAPTSALPSKTHDIVMQ